MPSRQSQAIRPTLELDRLDLDTPITEKRQEWDTWAATLPIPEGVTTEVESIAAVPCMWVRPDAHLDDQVILYLHGGGLVEGSMITTRPFAARLALATGTTVLVVDYRLAPEYPFPAALNDTRAVYRALLERGIRANQISFGGDSNGGGLALASLLDLKERGVDLPKALFLISPAVDLTFSAESMRTRQAVEPLVSEEVLIHCANLYAQGQDLTQPLISPLFGELAGLPPVLIQVGNHEILLDDSVRLAQRIEKGGGDATLHVWDDMWHVWHGWEALPEAAAALVQINEFLDRSP